MPHPVRPRRPEAHQGLGHGFIVFPEEPRPTPLEYYSKFDPEPPEVDTEKEEEDAKAENVDPWTWR